MAWYERMTVPSNTPIASPLVQDARLAPGTLDKIRVLHPTGCVDLVGVRFMLATHQLFPNNPGSWFTGNGDPIEFHPHMPLDTPPYTIQIEMYNLDVVFDHSPSVMLDIIYAGSYWDDLTESFALLGQSLILGGR